MSLESILERIAAALEKRNENDVQAVNKLVGVVSVTPGAVVEGPAKVTRKKKEEPVVEEQQEVDPLAEEAPPAKEWTLEDVRRVIIATRDRLQKAHGTERGGKEAIELLKVHGNGADTLGKLKPEFFDAVIKAAGAV